MAEVSTRAPLLSRPFDLAQVVETVDSLRSAALDLGGR